MTEQLPGFGDASRMPKKSLQDYVFLFQLSHPEIDLLEQQKTIAPEQVKRLGEIFAARVNELQATAELNRQQLTFIDNTVDLGSRVAVYSVDRHGIHLPHANNEFERRAERLYDSIGDMQLGQTFSREAFLSDKDAFAATLGLACGTSQLSVRQHPEHRSLVERYAVDIVPVLGYLAETNRGLPFDQYLQGNIHAMVAHYEATELQT